MSIKTRDFTEGGVETHLKKLSLLEVKHDFKNYSTDRTKKKRGTNLIDYFPFFKITNYRKAMGLNPTYSHYFDGCSSGYGAPEDYGLEQAVNAAKPTSTLVNYPADANKDPFYQRIATLLNAYKVDGKIPLVIDVQKTVNKDSNTYPKRQLIDNFVVCKNKEHYADPSRTYTQEFGEGIRRIDFDEVGTNKREYSEEEIHTGGGAIRLDGSIDEQTITYGTSGWKEVFHKKDSVAPNTITLCKKIHDKLTNAESATKNQELPYCNLFRDGTELPISYPDISVIKKIGAQLLKKRCGDQLQVVSCLKPISYKNGKTYGSKQKPCVFWSYDRLAIAFAILKKVPCVFQIPSKSAIVYIPSNVMRGGSCTRENLLDATEGSVESSELLVRLLNSNSECLDRFIESQFDFSQAEFDVRNLLRLLKYGKAIGWPGYDSIDALLFSKMCIDTPYGQVYTEGDEATAVPFLDSETNENVLFYSPSSNLSIYKTSPTTYDVRILRANDHTQVDHTIPVTNTILTGKTPDIFKFISEEDLLDSDAEEWGTVGFAAGSHMLAKLTPYLASREDPMSGGGSESFISQYQAFTVIMAMKPLDADLQKEYVRFGSLLISEFLNVMSDTESKFLVFTELSEPFMCLDSSDIRKGGYTSYELVLFIKYMCEIEDQSLFATFSFLPNLLRDLGDGHLLSELEQYMSRFTRYSHFYNDEAYSQLPDEFKTKSLSMLTTILEKIEADVKRIDSEMLAFDLDIDKMYEYLDLNFPHGFIGRQIATIMPRLGENINAAPSMAVADLYNNTVTRKRELEVPKFFNNERPVKRVRVYGGSKTKKRRYGKNKTHRRWSKY